MPDFHIFPDDILHACLKMKRKLTRTPEDIPSYFLVMTINSLVKPLTTMFNRFLSCNFVPVQWKNAFIVPIFKKGDRRKVGNYRPISLTSSLSRLFEAVIVEKMLSFVSQHNLISKSQFGFLPSKSTCGNLMNNLYYWLNSYSSSNSTNVLYTDIQKAFDSVNHRILINILHSFGLNAKLVSWIQTFLSNRQQRVCIGDSVSSPLPVLSGVPQGSIIGPFLFLLFINDITGCVHSQSVKVSLFADDSKLSSIEPQHLQISINNMNAWLTKRQLYLAPQKCAILKIKKTKVLDETRFYINQDYVNEVSSIKDLGVIVSNDLKWTNHIDHITNKASIISYQLLKTIKSNNIWTWMKLFTTYIRPMLEFNTPIWSPYLLKDINKIERVQRNFTKVAFNRCKIPFNSYEDRLSKIGYLSLVKRRKYFDLIMMFKIINNLNDVNFNDYFILNSKSYTLRSHSYQVKPKFNSTCSQWHHSFFSRIIPLWNTLPSHLVSKPLLRNFKHDLKIHLQSTS